MNENKNLVGRPYGGCAVLWNSDVKHDIVRLSFTSKRLCGIKICLSDNVTIIVMNMYMLCDLQVTGCNFMLLKNELFNVAVKHIQTLKVVSHK